MYYMRYVEGVPRSEQILWFINNYEKKEYRTADRQHVLECRDVIDNKFGNREDVGVKVRDCSYEYLDSLEGLGKRDTEVFYPTDNITLGELI